MTYRGLIVTGTSRSGKTTLVRQLVADHPQFKQVQAVTTRLPRNDDQGEYEFVSVEEFTALGEGGELLVRDQYRERYYGIKLTSIASVQDEGKTPVLVLTPRSAAELDGLRWTDKTLSQTPSYQSFYVDGPDDVLNSRIGDERVLPAARSQRARDREWAIRFLYRIDRGSPEERSLAVKTLWDLQHQSGVIPARIIRHLTAVGILLHGASPEAISNASYDLTLGDEFFYGGRINRLSEGDPFHLIEPYDYVIVTSRESAALPADVCGRFDLAVGLFCQGVILSNGPQVDPGFRGPLFALLLNASSSPVLLKRGQHYATLEMHKTLEPAVPYQGHYQDKTLLDYLPTNAARGAINELRVELTRVRDESRSARETLMATMSLMVAIIAILVTLRG